MRDLDELFAALGGSKFRSGVRLKEDDAAHLKRCGLKVVLEHATKFIRERLAPAQPANDGRQTPWRGHPVFVAQHATATCCRSCLAKWHGIAKGQPLSPQQIDYVVRVIRRWLEEMLPEPPTRTSLGVDFDGSRYSTEGVVQKTLFDERSRQNRGTRRACGEEH